MCVCRSYEGIGWLCLRYVVSAVCLCEGGGRGCVEADILWDIGFGANWWWGAGSRMRELGGIGEEDEEDEDCVDGLSMGKGDAVRENLWEYYVAVCSHDS